MKSEDYGYVVKNNVCLFQKGPLSQWWGGFKGQTGGFIASNALFNCPDDLEFDQESYEFNCCEQWMMANKATTFRDMETFKFIMEAKSPSRQKDLGRMVQGYDDKVWNL